jgi:hypothetical protein
MTKMIKTKDGRYVLRSEIVCVRDRKGQNVSDILTRDGKEYVISEGALGIAEECQSDEPAIAAQPGFWALVPDDLKKRDKVHFNKVPIIGWKKFKNMHTYWDEGFLGPFWTKPVFAGYYKFDERDWVQWGILHPDGRVFDQTFREFSDVGKFLEAASKELKKPCILI